MSSQEHENGIRKQVGGESVRARGNTMECVVRPAKSRSVEAAFCNLMFLFSLNLSPIFIFLLNIHNKSDNSHKLILALCDFLLYVHVVV